MGGDLSWEQGKRLSGRHLKAGFGCDGLSAKRPGLAHQRYLSGGAISSLDCAQGQEEDDRGSGSHDANHGLLHGQTTVLISGAGRRLLRSAQCGHYVTPTRQEAEKLGV